VRDAAASAWRDAANDGFHPVGEETATAGLVTTSRIGVLAESVRYTVRRTRIAHGQGITTTDVTVRGKGYASGAYCDDFGGTSSATSLVAGIAALVLSANKALKWTAVRQHPSLVGGQDR
jgi:subtilisin family serine protease